MKRKYSTLVVAAIFFLSVSCNISSNKNSGDMKMQCEVTGDGRPIVLVPGGLTGWASWEPFVVGFAEKRTVIRVQLLGVQLGLEKRFLPEDYSIKTESKALAATLDSLDYHEPVDVVAWSYGAFAALDYALDHPERIRTLTLIEPPAMWMIQATGKWDEETQKTADFMETFRGEITEDMLGEFLSQVGLVPPGKSSRDLPQWDYWVPFRYSLRMNPFVVSHQEDVERLKKFYPPTLLVKGTGSTAWLHQIIDGLADNMPQSLVVEFPGGHAPHLVSRDDFLVELEKFHNDNTP